MGERGMDGREVDRRLLGQEGEDAAARLLEAAGYVVRARNVRFRGGELDLVVERDNLIVFVEVRMRSSAAWGDPAMTVVGHKQRRVVLAARQFLARERIRERAVRFDVVSVRGRGADAVVEHIPNAFDAGG